MTTLKLDRHFRSSKVANVDGAFWFLKILTTAMGESTSDYFVHHFSPELAVVCAGMIFLFVLWWQLRLPHYSVTPYWATVVMVSIFGTMCADVVHVGLGVPYVASTIGFAVLLIAVFVTWYRVEGTLSIHSIVTTRRELFYWLSIVATFALGTATGDMTAVTLNLGYLASGILFALLFALPGLAYRFAGLNAVVAFWASYVLTRPLGASFADWLGVSHQRGGENWGNGNVSLVLSLAIVCTVFFLLRRTPRV